MPEPRRLSIVTAFSEDGNPNVQTTDNRQKIRRHSLVNALKNELRRISQYEPRTTTQQVGQQPQEEHDVEQGNNVIVDLKTVGDDDDPTKSGSLQDFYKEIRRDLTYNKLLSALLPVDQLFVVPASAEFDNVLLPKTMRLLHRFEILDSNGQSIYFAAELLEEVAETWSNHRDIDFIVLGRSGELICDITGSTRHAIVQDIKMSTHGTLDQANSSATKGFTVNIPKGEQDSTKYQLVPIGVAKGEEKEKAKESEEEEEGYYQIISPASTIGEIKIWANTDKDDRIKGAYGISFITGTEPETKLVLLSALLVLHFLHKVQPPEIGHKRRQFWAGVGYSVVVAILILIMIVIVLYYSIRPRPKLD